MANRDAGLEVAREPAGASGWTFLTNHAHVLLTIARDPQTTLRQVSALVGITERAVQKIVADLEATGYLTRTRHGRRNGPSSSTQPRYTQQPSNEHGPSRNPASAASSACDLIEAHFPPAHLDGPHSPHRGVGLTSERCFPRT